MSRQASLTMSRVADIPTSQLSDEPIYRHIAKQLSDESPSSQAMSRQVAKQLSKVASRARPKPPSPPFPPPGMPPQNHPSSSQNPYKPPSQLAETPIHRQIVKQLSDESPLAKLQLSDEPTSQLSDEPTYRYTDKLSDEPIYRHIAEGRFKIINFPNKIHTNRFAS